MPYIAQWQQERLEYDAPQTSGELNYLFTKTALNYWRENGHSYSTFNDIVGALEGCKLELYRRLIAPYEDTKIEENGDVYSDEGNARV